MKTTTPTVTLIGYLGKDVELRLTQPQDDYYEYTVFDPILEEDVVRERPTQVREYARLSLATHEGRGRRRRTRWHQLRVQHLDRHPHEHKIRTARKGQRVEIEGFPQVHHYKDKETGEPRTFRYIEVTSFRPRPGRRLYQPGDLSAR